MKQEEQPRLQLIVKMGTLEAFNDMISLTPNKTLSEVNQDVIGNVAKGYERELTALGADGLDTEVATPQADSNTAMPPPAAAPMAPPTPQKDPDNLKGWPEKPCPKCATIMKYSDAKEGYVCPTDGLNPKAGPFKRFLTGAQETTTAVTDMSVQTAAAAGSSVGAVYGAQANINQSVEQAKMGPPPVVGDPNAPTCPVDNVKTTYSDQYKLYACTKCRSWYDAQGTKVG